MKKDKILFLLGVLSLLLWVIDFINVIFFVKKPEYLLWYSSSGLLFTSIALLSRSPKMISIMFCSLFVLESIWVIDFLGKIIFNSHFWGVTNYMFAQTLTKKDFVISLYHLFIPPALLIAMIRTKIVFRYSWLGSIVYGSVLAYLTLILGSKGEIVNCVHQLTRCRGFFSFILTLLPYPYHIFTTILFTTIIVYIPTNYILLKVAKKPKWRILPASSSASSASTT